MKSITNRSFFTIILLILAAGLSAQLTVQNFTACPNQVVSVSATWPNVQITNLTLTIPAGGFATGNGNLLANPNFTIRHSGPGQVVTTWTLYGSGNNINGPTTSSVVFNLTIDPPAALSFTPSYVGSNEGYCPGTTATIEVTPGGNSYNVSGPNSFFLQNLTSNVVTIPNITPGHSGNYSVTSIGTCTAYGTVNIQVAPNSQITVSQSTNVCQGTNVTLLASMTGGSGWQWYDPQNNNFSSGTFVNLMNIAPPGGLYRVEAIHTFNFGGGSIECPRTATTLVTVVATSPVNLSASPTNIVCEGTKLTMNANTSPSAVSYNWVGPNGFGSSLSNPVINMVNNGHAGNYTVTALFTNNFATCTTSAAIQIQVVPVTVPVITMPAAACQNDKIFLSATGGTNASWAWFGPGFSSNLQTTAIDSVQPGNSGTYYVTAVYSLFTTTCAATSIPAQLTVVPVNTISVIPPKPVCQPDNAYLQASSTGANHYTWAGPGGYTAPGSNVTVYYPTPASSGIYTVTAYFGGGNLTCTNTETVSLQVYPILKFTLIPRQQTCYNASVAVNGPPGATSYTWTSSTGFTSNNRDIDFPSIQPKDAGSYTLAVSLGSCITSASTQIEVLTPISFTLVPKSRELCLGDTVLLEAAVTGGSENYAYAWNPPLYMASPTGPTQRFVPLGSVQYNLIVHDIACPSFSLGHAFDVVVHQPPKPQLELSAIQGCAPFTLLYDTRAWDETAITTFDFGGNRQFQRDSAFHYTLKDPGTYTLNVLSKGFNGCLGKYTFPYPLVVYPRPGADIYWSPERPTTSDEITFYPTSTGGPIVYNNWAFSGGVSTELPDSLIRAGDGDTTNIWTPRRKYDIYGKYPVMLVLINEQGCIDTVLKYLDVIDDMNVYIPNTFTPNDDGINDYFGVVGQGMKSEGFLMELRDRSGNIMFRTRDINEKWDGKLRGQTVMDGTYTYLIRVVGMNGEGRREYVGHFTLLK